MVEKLPNNSCRPFWGSWIWCHKFSLLCWWISEKDLEPRGFAWWVWGWMKGNLAKNRLCSKIQDLCLKMFKILDESGSGKDWYHRSLWFWSFFRISSGGFHDPKHKAKVDVSRCRSRSMSMSRSMSRSIWNILNLRVLPQVHSVLATFWRANKLGSRVSSDDTSTSTVHGKVS